jgi:hypothetical protein
MIRLLSKNSLRAVIVCAALVTFYRLQSRRQDCSNADCGAGSENTEPSFSSSRWKKAREQQLTVCT